MTGLRKVTHFVYSHFVRWLFPFSFTDPLAGLKGMRRAVTEAVLPFLTIDRFSFDVELFLVATNFGFRITEVPVALKSTGKSNLAVRSDAPKMIEEIIKIWWKDKRGHYKVPQA